MARPTKYTVDYFAHDANASSGKTLTILFNNFGHEGISTWWQLLECISLANNHVICINNSEELEYLAARLHLKTDRLTEILEKLAQLGAIDSACYASKMIWSQNFVNRLKPVYDSRKQQLPLKPVVSSTNNEVSLDKNPVSLPDNTYTILKRETKERERGAPHGEFKNVLLLPEELTKLYNKFGERDANERIEKLSAYKKSKGKHYDSDYATILNWARKDCDGGNGHNSIGNPSDKYEPVN